MLALLYESLRDTRPDGFIVRREISVVLDDRQRPEPDVTVLRDTGADPRSTWYPADTVELAVEVVSPESQRRDRERKPQLYAGAGIPHFWRVELRDGKPVVHTYERDVATGQYALTGICRDRPVLSVPFATDIDLTRAEKF